MTATDIQPIHARRIALRSSSEFFFILSRFWLTAQNRGLELVVVHIKIFYRGLDIGMVHQNLEFMNIVAERFKHASCKGFSHAVGRELSRKATPIEGFG